MDFGQYVFSPPYFGWLCHGLLMTLMIGLASSLCASLAGFLALRCQLSTFRLLKMASACYVIIFRNLPLVPLLLFLTFGLPEIWQQLSGRSLPRGLELSLLLLGLSLNAGAYLSEILRAGIDAVAFQQINAARTLGLAPGTIRRRILYPQALRIVAPALATRFIHIMKNATMALVVPLPVQGMELLGQAGRIAGQTFSWAEPLIAVAAIYLLLALCLGRILNGWASREHARIGAE